MGIGLAASLIARAYVLAFSAKLPWKLGSDGPSSRLFASNGYNRIIKLSCSHNSWSIHDLSGFHA